MLKYLEDKFITPDMFAIPWFLTLFATKIETNEIVLKFWERISDPTTSETMIFFIAVALILRHKAQIMQAQEALLPELMSSLSFKSMQDVD